MKVAYILDIFPAFSETFIVREIIQLQNKDFEVFVFARKDTRGTTNSEVIHSESKGLLDSVYYYPSKQKRLVRFPILTVYHLLLLFTNPLRYMKTLSFAIRQGQQSFRVFVCSVIYAMKIKKFGLTHIHAHFALDASTYAMFCSMLTGVPYSFTIHAHDIFLSTASSLAEKKFKSAKFVACISEYNKKYILQQYPTLDSEHMKIVHCGVNTQELNPKSSPRSQKFTILSVGRLAEQKGFRHLILACELLRKSQQLDFVCKIIGEGKERSLLEELIFASDLEETVYLLGAMEQHKVLEALKSADVFVLPCVVEKTNSRDGIPVALMEAMALEIPVISTKVSGIPELVKDGAGFLVAPEDPEALAEIIIKVSILSPESRKALGRRGRAIVAQEFNLEKEVEKLIRFFTN